MRKERGGLEEITETASLCWGIDARRRVEKDFVSYRDAAFVGNDEAGNAVEERRFSGARGAEENGDARRNREIDIEMKCGARETRANVELC